MRKSKMQPHQKQRDDVRQVAIDWNEQPEGSYAPDNERESIGIRL